MSHYYYVCSAPMYQCSPHWLAVCKMQTRQITHSILLQYSQHLALDTNSTRALLCFTHNNFMNLAVKLVDFQSVRLILYMLLHYQFISRNNWRWWHDQCSDSSVSGVLRPRRLVGRWWWSWHPGSLGSHQSPGYTAPRSLITLLTSSPRQVSSPLVSLQRTFKIETKPELMTN